MDDKAQNVELFLGCTETRGLSGILGVLCGQKSALGSLTDWIQRTCCHPQDLFRSFLKENMLQVISPPSTSELIQTL